MEDVWGNISLPSLHNPTTKPPNLGAFNSVGGGGTNFYDFFSNKNPYSDQERLANYPKTNSLPNINQMGFVENPSSSSFAKKRPPNDEDESANDRRRQRLIKNRESADRSRARRQAYTNELEQEIENLKKENAKLREKVGIIAAATTTTTTAAAAAAKQLKSTKRNSLCRTLSAPF